MSTKIFSLLIYVPFDYMKLSLASVWQTWNLPYTPISKHRPAFPNKSNFSQGYHKSQSTSVQIRKGASSPRRVASICWKSVIIHWLLDILSQSREMEQIYKSTISKRWLAPPCWGGEGALLQCTTCPTVWSHPALNFWTVSLGTQTLSVSSGRNLVWVMSVWSWLLHPHVSGWLQICPNILLNLHDVLFSVFLLNEA